MQDSALLTEQLRLFSAGDRDVAEAVLRKVLPELHRIAIRELRKERSFAPLSATELIDEVWLQSLHKGGFPVTSRSHFYAIAALAMRRVLVDFARKRLAQRRGEGNVPESMQAFPSKQISDGSDLEKVVSLGLLTEQLDLADPDCARIVDLHFFSGFTIEEISEKTGLTKRQVRMRWQKGRDWLKARL